MNEIQHNNLIKLKSLVKKCDHIDIVLRINNKNEFLEADFLKDLILGIPQYDAPKER